MSGLEISLKGPFCSKRSLNNTEFQLSMRLGSSSNWQTSKTCEPGWCFVYQTWPKGSQNVTSPKVLVCLSCKIIFWGLFSPAQSLPVCPIWFLIISSCIYIFKWHNMKCAPWFSTSNGGRVCNLSYKGKLFQKLDWPAALYYSLLLSLASLCAFINKKCAKM